MDQYRRYGRWLKRAAWVLALYLYVLSRYYRALPLR